MNCKFINVLVFAVGAAIGSAVTWKVVKTKYERIAQEEIDSVKEAFADRFGERKETLEDLKNKVDTLIDAEERHEQAKQIDWAELEDLNEEDDEDEETEENLLNDYARLLDVYNKKKGGGDDMKNEPYVISPYDFGELDGYSQIELTYYSDGTLEDDEYNILTDWENLIGKDSLTTFGEYEDDSVFVRNDDLRADFQILKDYRTYEQARSINPHQVNNE
jgi:hypothetical protein